MAQNYYELPASIILCFKIKLNTFWSFYIYIIILIKYIIIYLLLNCTYPITWTLFDTLDGTNLIKHFTKNHLFYDNTL